MPFATLRHRLPTLAIAACAVVALRQWARVRRAFGEIAAPENLPLPVPAPAVAIILSVRDEAANIDGIVAALLAQEGVNYELFVIDDGSTDATPALLAAWAARDQRLHLHRSIPCRRVGRARHARRTPASA